MSVQNSVHTNNNITAEEPADAGWFFSVEDLLDWTQRKDQKDMEADVHNWVAAEYASLVP
ncbi:6399_t:CDS:2 [Paraglomus occultum]|uniref:6399_t:CDS:1 n=1 Tax=Paraglomus occultum TaxID=144539 RepID=A0A9N8VQB2_9GLOM|nr:6399_t:CDS:2 [Paraglomus occultum]